MLKKYYSLILFAIFLVVAGIFLLAGREASDTGELKMEATGSGAEGEIDLQDTRVDFEADISDFEDSADEINSLEDIENELDVIDADLL